MQAIPADERRCSAPAIGDYAVIGDCRTAALVSREGSIDWLCLPDFSSPSTFAAILDPVRGGRFSLEPVGAFEVSRRYLDDTPVLETVFTTPSGAVRITDAMVLGDRHDLYPQREVLRVVEGLHGSVPVAARFTPRPDYARKAPAIQRRGAALICSWGGEQLLLRSDVPLELSPASRGDEAVGRFLVNEGERFCFSLGYTDRDIGIVLPLGEGARARIQGTVEWWRNWVRRCQYEGPYQAAVIRSAITLKLMTFCLSGAVVAAPTTSLPEAIGGDRNWDYRYCWLRDAALVMRAFLGLGLLDEAEAFLRWLLHATVLSQPALDVMYDVYGRNSLDESELEHLSGFRNSRPVRRGNGAWNQVQLDVYGGVIAAAVQYAEKGGVLQPDERRLLTGFGRIICEQWRNPDNGIWEIRGERQQYTFSKVMCWIGLDCLLRLSEMHPLNIDRNAFARERDAIRDAVETRGYRDPPGSYVGVLDQEWLDASLLLMSCLGYEPSRSSRMRATFEALTQRLGKNGRLYRYEPGTDGFASREGAFGICAFWAVDNLATRGEMARADQLFRQLLGDGNDLWLFSEEVDPETGELLGNFPQAFTHVGLINAALALLGHVPAAAHDWR